MRLPRLRSGGKTNWMFIFVVISLIVLFCSPLIVVYLNIQAIESTAYDQYQQGYYVVPLDIPVTVGAHANRYLQPVLVPWFLWFWQTIYIDTWHNLGQIWAQMSPQYLQHKEEFYPISGAQATGLGFTADTACAGGDYSYVIYLRVYDYDTGEYIPECESYLYYNQKAYTTAIHHLRVSIPTGDDGLPSSEYRIELSLVCTKAGGYSIGSPDWWGRKIPNCDQSWNQRVTPNPDKAKIQMYLYQISSGYEQTYSMVFFILVLPLALCVGYIYGERKNIWLVLILLLIAGIVAVMSAGMYMQIFNEPALAPMNFGDLGRFLNDVVGALWGFGASAQSQISLFFNAMALELVSISMGVFGGYLLYLTKRRLE